jgi:hypothetical protein
MRNASDACASTSRLKSARRDAFLDAVWDAGAAHAAVTPTALRTDIIDHVRKRPDYDALRLERLVHWLDGLRTRQADSANQIATGFTEVNRLLSRIISAFDADFYTQHPPASEIPA